MWLVQARIAILQIILDDRRHVRNTAPSYNASNTPSNRN